MSLRILIIEDEVLNQQLLRDFLNGHGYQPVIVSSGEEALAFMDEEPFQIAFIDRQLPGIGGDAVLQYIREQDYSLNRKTYCISLSGEAAQTQYDAHLQKPFPLQALLSLIDNYKQLPGLWLTPSSTHSLDESKPEELTSLIYGPEAMEAAFVKTDCQLDFFESLFEHFKEVATDLLATLETHLRQQSSLESLQTAHILKGAAAIFEMVVAMDRIQQLEHRLKASDFAWAQNSQEVFILLDVIREEIQDNLLSLSWFIEAKKGPS